VLILEHTPRFGVQELKKLAAWPRFMDSGVAKVVLDVDGHQIARDIELMTDEASLGIRWWISCPDCGGRRLHLYVVNGEVTCRCCAGLLYLQQSWPDSRWRREVGIPLLRTMHQTS
jgi:hypothetical protein